jgi:PHD/YefM family antitoxin component YafN of YafNO toxin-antitoxin module
MATKPKSVKETRTTYRPKRQTSARSASAKITLRWRELESATQPIILERDGQPVAVVIKYADYQRLDKIQIERRQKAWRELDALLAQVHARTQSFAVEEIETDITDARREVREQHHAARHRD